MKKIRWMIFIIVVGLMNSAFAASIYLPLRFAERWGNDPPNSVTATIFKNVTDSVDQVALTRHANAPGLGVWFDSISIDLPGIFIVNYAAVWTSGNDTARVQQMFPFIYDPPTNTELEARTLPTADYFDPDADTTGLGTGTYAALAKEASLFDYTSDVVVSDVHALDGDTLSLEDLKDFADDGYDPDGDTVHTDIATGTGLDSAAVDVVISVVVNDSNLARNVTKTDYQSTTGPGAINVRILALDTVNTVAVEDVDITMKLADGTKKHVAETGADGWASMTMNSVTYHVLAQHGNYVFTTPACTLTVPADSLRDTVRCYPFDPGSPESPDLKRIYGWIYDLAGNALEGAIVSLTLDVPGDTIPRQTGTGVTIYRTAVRDTTDADGYWSLDVEPTDGLTPALCEYVYRATYNNKYLRYHSKKFAAPGTNTQAITEF